jgi:hypothetical protein
MHTSMKIKLKMMTQKKDVLRREIIQFSPLKDMTPFYPIFQRRLLGQSKRDTRVKEAIPVNLEVTWRRLRQEY